MRFSLRGLVALIVITAIGGFSLSYLVGDRETSDLVVRPDWRGQRFPSVAFVVTCKQSHVKNDDPILFPDQPGTSHEHAFFGNKSTNASSTVSSMEAAGTTCDEPKDQAAYWTPTPAGEYLRAYYDVGDADVKTVSAFFPGMQGIAGSAKNEVPGVESVAFRCGAVSDGPDVSGWVGTAIDSCDGRAIPVVRYTFGQCGVARIEPCGSKDAAQYVRLRLVMPWAGTMAGMGPHADFWNVWDQRRLEQLVAICVRGERKSNIEIKQCRLNGAGPAHS